MARSRFKRIEDRIASASGNFRLARQSVAVSSSRCAFVASVLRVRSEWKWIEWLVWIVPSSVSQSLPFRMYTYRQRNKFLLCRPREKEITTLIRLSTALENWRIASHNYNAACKCTEVHIVLFHRILFALATNLSALLKFLCLRWGRKISECDAREDSELLNGVLIA